MEDMKAKDPVENMTEAEKKSAGENLTMLLESHYGYEIDAVVLAVHKKGTKGMGGCLIKGDRETTERLGKFLRERTMNPLDMLLNLFGI